MLIFGFGILILNIIAKWSVMRYLILSTFSICVEYIEVKIKSNVLPPMCVGLFMCWCSECESVSEIRLLEGVSFKLTWKLKSPSNIVLSNCVVANKSLRSLRKDM